MNARLSGPIFGRWQSGAGKATTMQNSGVGSRRSSNSADAITYGVSGVAYGVTAALRAGRMQGVQIRLEGQPCRLIIVMVLLSSTRLLGSRGSLSRSSGFYCPPCPPSFTLNRACFHQDSLGIAKFVSGADHPVTASGGLPISDSRGLQSNAMLLVIADSWQTWTLHESKRQKDVGVYQDNIN